MTIINRYLAREVLANWVGVTSVLLVIIASHRFARFLGEAAAGKLPGTVVFELLAFTSVGFLTVLIPVGLFLGLLMAFGRLYRDSEMTALIACGVGPAQLYRPVMLLALLVALVLSAFTFQFGPWAAQEALETRRAAEKEAEIGMFESGRFKSARGGEAVFYAERVDEQTGELYGLFLSQRKPGNEQTIVNAARGGQKTEPGSGRRLLVLHDGTRFDGTPGRADFRVMKFAEYGVQVAAGDPDLATTNRNIAPTMELLGSDDPLDVAELQWRLSGPLMALVLAVIAVPLSRTRPREGRYGRILFGILIYIVYSNLLGVARLGMERGQIHPDVGLWPVHLLFLAAGGGLLIRSVGWRYSWRALRGAHA